MQSFTFYLTQCVDKGNFRPGLRHSVRLVLAEEIREDDCMLENVRDDLSVFMVIIK